jgi:hypothetical protein
MIDVNRLFKVCAQNTPRLLGLPVILIPAGQIGEVFDAPQLMELHFEFARWCWAKSKHSHGLRGKAQASLPRRSVADRPRQRCFLVRGNVAVKGAGKDWNRGAGGNNQGFRAAPLQLEYRSLQEGHGWSMYCIALGDLLRKPGAKGVIGHGDPAQFAGEARWQRGAAHCLRRG